MRTPRAKRKEILDEFEGSGVEFAELAGIKHPTLANWGQRRRWERRRLGRKGPAKPDRRMRFLEAGPVPLEVELPDGVRLRITGPEEVPFAVQLVRELASC